MPINSYLQISSGKASFIGLNVDLTGVDLVPMGTTLVNSEPVENADHSLYMLILLKYKTFFFCNVQWVNICTIPFLRLLLTVTGRKLHL